jgi:hypothetical protein
MYIDEKRQGEAHNFLEDRRLRICEVLLDAADYIVQHGWCQGIFQASGGQVCAIGALRNVADEQEWAWAAAEQLASYIGYHRVPEWNDSPARTSYQVIGALRAAAREMKA